jgi:hypothetical protein
MPKASSWSGLSAEKLALENQKIANYCTVAASSDPFGSEAKA